jgi:hypothetical protein
MNRQELKNKHLELDEYEPFTAKEKEKYNAKDRSMIRNIQILNNFKKKDALKILTTYKGSSKDALKQLAKAYRKRLTKGYPKTKPERRGRIIHQDKQKAPSKREVGVRAKQREKVAEYKKDVANRNKVNYQRITKAHKKYIDASKPELEHGVNSKWSQNYRQKKGLSTKYTGRIIK